MKRKSITYEKKIEVAKAINAKTLNYSDILELHNISKGSYDRIKKNLKQYINVSNDISEDIEQDNYNY